MTKILVDVDDEALEAAAKRFGTKTKKDTVNTALRRANEDYERAEALVGLKALADEGGLDLELLNDKRNYRR
ncbi:type II toxin-antitoxin system VapB family antitoxin [Nocardiopsis suaedae]|uniref:Type II toxin-antitoxin system VapB family antitoxin n=1 Tax=Nocardiopsis suaedae TaxID=3018444 RepID=A0ABT4TRM6_9ACTN|nr:type II toxin-antitoxin system VapB family antitoxin [Nocardiopsis suaedae]MDA2807322.1 type II toxin-antitoxin system VapB family antitoxin [Nocardiopsis suaedae]